MTQQDNEEDCHREEFALVKWETWQNKVSRNTMKCGRSNVQEV